MNKQTFKTLAILSAITAFNVQAGASNGNHNSDAISHEMPSISCALTGGMQQSALSQNDKDKLLFMREEEKLARDVHQFLYQKWPVNVFNNIAKSEQQHMDPVQALLDTYGLPDPARAEVGEFNNQIVQTLYDQLIARGSISALDAYKVGAYIEEIDIKDLEEAISSTQVSDLASVYTQLMNASYNHLRAFTRQIIALEGNYSAQALTQEQVDAILNNSAVAPAAGNANTLANGINSINASCFTADLTADKQAVNIAFTVKVPADVIGKTASWAMVAAYTPSNGSTMLYARNTTQWQIWDGNLNNLPAATTAAKLQQEQTLNVFSGSLAAMPGTYSITIGYRLSDNSIVYNRQPLTFTVKP